jgi:hypothetical protein
MSDDRDQLVRRLELSEGTLEEAEAWLEQLKHEDPYFSGSDYMHSLEVSVRSRRLLERMVAQHGTQPTREQLIALVQNILNAEGSEEEYEANLGYLRRCVLDPKVTDYIYYPLASEELSAEAIVDRALTYTAIQL